MANDTRAPRRRRKTTLTPERLEHLHKLAVENGTVAEFYSQFKSAGVEMCETGEVKLPEQRTSFRAWIASDEGQDCVFPGRLPSQPHRAEIELERRLKLAFDAGRRGT